MEKHFAALKSTVIDQELCTRCGICAGVCPAGALTLNEEYYPELTGECLSCGFCHNCCSGAEVNFPELSRELFNEEHDPINLQGHVENTYVSHPVDTDVRYAGASGGLVSGLLLYLLNKGTIDGAVIVGADPERPYRSKGVLATTPEEILHGAQSKYCVTGSMEVLQQLRKRKGKYAVVALPCQIHGLRKLAKVDKGLYKKIYAILGLYCTCTMDPNGHLEAMEAAGVSKDDVARFDFRGGGWPGGMHVMKKDKSRMPLHLSTAFGTVINVMFRLFGAKRCYLCIDGLAEHADLSFGDFWAFDYPDEFIQMERCTLVSQRTRRGWQILNAAQKDGAIVKHLLPKERFSKRILAMVKGKRNRAKVFLSDRRKRHQRNPNYHLHIPEPTIEERRKNISYRIFNIFRGPRGRKFILNILFSPLNAPLHQFNRWRQKMFAQYHNS